MKTISIPNIYGDIITLRADKILFLKQDKQRENVNKKTNFQIHLDHPSSLMIVVEESCFNTVLEWYNK